MMIMLRKDRESGDQMVLGVVPDLSAPDRWRVISPESELGDNEE